MDAGEAETGSSRIEVVGNYVPDRYIKKAPNAIEFQVIQVVQKVSAPNWIVRD